MFAVQELFTAAHAEGAEFMGKLAGARAQRSVFSLLELGALGVLGGERLLDGGRCSLSKSSSPRSTPRAPRF